MSSKALSPACLPMVESVAGHDQEHKEVQVALYVGWHILRALVCSVVCPVFVVGLILYTTKEIYILPVIWKIKRIKRMNTLYYEDAPVDHPPIITKKDIPMLITFFVEFLLILAIICYLFYLIQTGKGF